MKVRILTHIHDAHTFAPEECAEKVAAYAPGRFRAWKPRETDKGELVGLYCIEVLHAGEEMDLPVSQAEKLIRIGYAQSV